VPWKATASEWARIIARQNRLLNSQARSLTRAAAARDALMGVISACQSGDPDRVLEFVKTPLPGGAA
jgi:hypothetical protein